jgi:ankyrin repeat protein
MEQDAPLRMLSKDDPLINLAIAAREGNIEYLRAGVDQFMTLDEYGDSVLSHAIDENTEASYRSMEFIAKTRYFHGLLNIPSHDGNYPLLYAALRENMRFLSFLLERGARVLVPHHGRNPPLSLLHMLIGDNKILALHIILTDLEAPGKYTRKEIDALFACKRRMQGEIVSTVGHEPLTPIELAARLGVKIYAPNAAQRLRTQIARDATESEVYS